MAQTSLELARRLGERGAEAPAHRLLGDLHARLGTGEEATAEAHYREAIALGTEVGLRPEVARSQLGLGLLLRRRGELADARIHLDTAQAGLRDMGMTYWLARLPA
jgi:hypothetical protein